jgi:hypothetical protein
VRYLLCSFSFMACFFKLKSKQSRTYAFDPTAVLENESRLPLCFVERLQLIMMMLTVGVGMMAMKQWQHQRQGVLS